MTRNEMNKKYPEPRETMTEEREKEFVEDCFSYYEAEGFSKRFWSPYDSHKKYVYEAFEVVGRCTTDDCDLCTLPMWRIKFSDETIISVYPEEIISSEMKANGCTFKKY